MFMNTVLIFLLFMFSYLKETPFYIKKQMVAFETLRLRFFAFFDL